MYIRLLTEDDWEALGLVISEAFSRGEQRPAQMTDDQRETFQLARRLGAFDGAELVAAATIFDIDVHWNGAACRMGGIAGVCCKASARGRGHVAALMHESMVEMRKWGQPISGLYGFSHAFYRRVGYETAVLRREFTVPTRIIPSDPEGRNVRTYVGSDALEIVKPVYDRYALNYQGMTTRGNRVPAWWDSALKSSGGRSTYVQVYINPDSRCADGYFTFRFPENGQPACLGEFITNTPEAYRGLLATLHNYNSQVDAFMWSGPADHPLPLFINEHEMQTAIRPSLMGRIVDAESALSLLQATRDGAAVVRIHDEQAAWNDRTFDVIGAGAKVTVGQSAANPQCEMDIQTLALACWGTYSLTALRAAGRITATDEGAFDFLSDLLPARVPYITDGF